MVLRVDMSDPDLFHWASLRATLVVVLMHTGPVPEKRPFQALGAASRFMAVLVPVQFGDQAIVLAVKSSVGQPCL